MNSNALRCCIALVLFCSAAASVIKFGENDYLGDETSGTLRVGVSKDGSNTGNITAQVTPMTLSQFTTLYGANPYSTTRNPAEMSDFNPEPHTVTFEASAGNADKDVFVEIMNDNLFEEEEFFLVVLEVVNSQASDQVELERNVTICRLRPDSKDRLTITLYSPTTPPGEQIAIAVNESTRNATDLLYIMASGDSEHPVSVTLTTRPTGGATAADLDMPTVRTFEIHPPAVNLTAVPISIVDDDILEEDNERFRVTLEANSLYDLGVHSAIFDIIDNDPVHFGFTETEFVIVEGESVAICIAVFSDGELDKPIDGNLAIEPADTKGAARLDQDYFFLEDESTRSACVMLQTTDDKDPQFPRVFTIRAEDVSIGTTSLHTLSPDTANITIIDNDRAPNPPTITNVEPTSNNKDLLIEWTATSSELRPIDGYTGSIKVSSSATNKIKRDTTTEDSDIIPFRTVRKSYVYIDADMTKVYEITICAYNNFGVACGLPFTYSLDTNTTAIPSESGDEKDDDDIEIWIIIVLIVVAVLLPCCCFLLLCLLCCGCRRRSKNYYPAEIEKKHAEEYQKYRESRSESTLSDFDSDLSAD